MTDTTEVSGWNFEQNYPKDQGKLGEYLKRTGQPMCCRLDLRVTSLEELKWAAVLISNLNKDLQKIAYDDERDPVLRVILARHMLNGARISLKYLKPNVTKNAAKKTGAGRTSSTTYRASPPTGVGNLDKPWKRPTLPRQHNGEKTDE